MTFVSPMLASPRPAGFAPRPGEWVAEEKFDGHRLIVSVRPDAKGGGPMIQAWSRDELPRVLPPHLRRTLALLPHGTYDGELCVPGKRSYGVTELANANKLVFVAFDILAVRDGTVMRDVTALPWAERRRLLEFALGLRCLDLNHNGDANGEANDRGCGNDQCFNHKGTAVKPCVMLSTVWPIDEPVEVQRLADAVWQVDGEGLILKRTSSRYQPGKRPKDWLKIKQLRSAKLRITGFLPAKSGPYSVALLRDAKGYETQVRTGAGSQAVMRRVVAAPQTFVGRELWIEYQERTPDGSYRHPRWDRLEGE